MGASPIHCGGLPAAYRDAATLPLPCIRHYGWSRADEHEGKYRFYRERDLAAYGRARPHTESILQAQVTVEPWVEAQAAPWLSELQPGGGSG